PRSAACRRRRTRWKSARGEISPCCCRWNGSSGGGSGGPRSENPVSRSWRRRSSVFLPPSGYLETTGNGRGSCLDGGPGRHFKGRCPVPSNPCPRLSRPAALSMLVAGAPSAPSPLADMTPALRNGPHHPPWMPVPMTPRRWLYTFLACLLVLLVLASIKFLQIRAAIAFGESFPEPTESVQALVVAPTPAALEVSTLGEIIAPRSVELRNELAGKVSAVNLTPGGRFAKGDVLIQLDVSEESARHQSALASAALARLALERQQALVKRGSASQAQLDQARAERDIAEANARQLAALIAKKTLTAPFDGIAGLHDLEAGDYLEANTPLVLLQGLSDSLWVDFSLSPAQGRLDIGDAVRVV